MYPTGAPRSESTKRFKWKDRSFFGRIISAICLTFVFFMLIKTENPRERAWAAAVFAASVVIWILTSRVVRIFSRRSSAE